MMENQYNWVHRRVTRGDTEQLWYSIFEVLFPGAQRPPSPYVCTVDPVALAHFVNLFRAVGPGAMLDFMRDRREQAGGNLQLEIPTQMLIDEAFEVAAPHYLEHVSMSRQDSINLGSTASLWNNQEDVAVEASRPATQPLADMLSREQAVVSEANYQPSHIPFSQSNESYIQNDPAVPDLSQQMMEPLVQPTSGDYNQYLVPTFDFDPSMVNAGFDNYATIGNTGHLGGSTDIAGPSVHPIMSDIADFDANHHLMFGSPFNGL